MEKRKTHSGCLDFLFEYAALDKGHMFTESYALTPSEAELIDKKRNTENFRTPTENVLRDYCDLIDKNEFLGIVRPDVDIQTVKPHPQGIAFDTRGILQDGQKRIKAIAKCGKVVVVSITFNADEAARDCTDQNEKRSSNQILNHHFKDDIPKNGVPSILRYVHFGLSKNKLKQYQLKEVYIRHSNALNWLLDSFNTNQKGLNQASVKAALIRAYYEDKTKATLAAHKLSSGKFCEIPGEGSLYALREWLRNGKYNFGSDGQLEVFGKSQRALRGYFDGIDLEKLYMPTENLFGLPKTEREIQRTHYAMLAHE